MTADEEPALVVGRGDPGPEELAALIAVLAQRRAGAGAAPTDQADRRAQQFAWADRRALVRTPLQPGPGAWQRSGRP